jgi:hypothetical protein
MKSNKKKLGDVGIRLKPKESNILENYMKHRKRTHKKKKSKKKKSFKSIEIKAKKDPFLQIVEDNQNKNKKEDLVVTEIKQKTEDKPEDKPEETRTIHVDSKPKDLSETDPNVKKTIMITASLKPEKKKEGTGVILE